jgi:hypothetical protein
VSLAIGFDSRPADDDWTRVEKSDPKPSSVGSCPLAGLEL